MAAEVALADEAARRAVEDGTPALQLADAIGGVLGVQLGHAPAVEELATPHGVAKVDAPVVLRCDVAERRRAAAFGHDGVRLAEQRFAHQAGRQTLAAALDCSAQSGA